MSAADLVGERSYDVSVARDCGTSDGHRLVRQIAILIVGLPIVLAITDIVNAVSWLAAFVRKRAILVWNTRNAARNDGSGLNPG